ncbi:DUF2161 domain-containing protein [Paenibacillus sediminis]|uniref:Restriction endonuclease n=1 Tax=Paenibacillus sediminis TaxID=664909 RepID=A0ABS4H5Q2_9BACL|nr:DUF2161 family putative PD-(D/E)XK-type phosphodiesterase [Paenibacillus sediminis]MBP1937858.1 hypothetical protein [Paenibacillus sediminis]
MAVRHETELYKPIKNFFEIRGYEIKSEVRHCDLVGMKQGEEEPLIVEMKKTFNLPLLLQGMERLKLSSNVYLAVERNRHKKGAHNQRWSEITALCRKIGVGLITVTHFKTKSPFVEILCEPSAFASSKPIVKTRQSRLVQEFKERSGDYNVGGSHGQKIVTSYREKALRVAHAMRDGTPMRPSVVRDLSGTSSAAAILQRNYYGWFERVSRGLYVLTPAGKEALEEYHYVIEGRL